MPTEPTQFTEAEVVETMPTQKILSIEETVTMLVEQAKLSAKQVMIDNGGAQQLKDWTKELKKIEIKSHEDKEAYLKAKAINLKVAKYRIAFDKERKAKKELPIRVGKGIEEVIAEYQSYVKPVEDLSDEKMALYESLKKAEEDREANEKELRTQTRKSELESNGLTFNGTWWVINEITVGIQMITDMTVEEYEKLLASVKKQNELNIEAKRLQDEAEAKAKKEAEELAEKNRIESERIANEALALKNERTEMRKSQLEMLGIIDFKLYQLNIENSSSEDWKWQLDKVKSDLELVKKNAEILAQQTEYFNRKEAQNVARHSDLIKLGMFQVANNFSSNGNPVYTIYPYHKEAINIDFNTIQTLSNEDWDAKIISLGLSISDLKNKIENDKRIKDEADKKEQDRINTLVLSRQAELLEIGLRYSNGTESYKVGFLINDMNEYVEIEKSLVVSLSDNDFKAKVAEMKTDIEALEVKYEQYKKDVAEANELARQNILSDKEKINEYIYNMDRFLVILSTTDKQLVFDGLLESFKKQIKSI